MTLPKYRIEDKIDEYLIPLIRGARKDSTIKSYRYLLTRQLTFLADNGYHYSPKSIGREEIEFLIKNYWIKSPKFNHNMRTLFKSFLDYFGNHIMIEYPEPVGSSSMRTNVDWLEDEEAVHVYSQEMSPVTRMIIHLELMVGLRRYDLLSLKLKDIEYNCIQVFGKGNKYRTVPFVTDTRIVVNQYMEYRDELTKGNRDPNSPFILITRGKQIKCPGKTYVDKYVKETCKKAGIERPISNHTLRRTCGRMWWRSGVKIATISMLFGHSDEKTTMRYLGIAIDDMNDAADQFGGYFKAISERSKKY